MFPDLIFLVCRVAWALLATKPTSHTPATHSTLTLWNHFYINYIYHLKNCFENYLVQLMTEICGKMDKSKKYAGTISAL